VAATDIPVLIIGETGSGKESAARAVHERSRRRDRKMVAINCAALPENLIESELFGYEKGAFSGAAAAKPGLLESAAQGTVFLDEVGELTPAAQAKLLRVLECKRVARLGAVTEREVDVRVVAATNRNLDDDAKAGRFRRDLYFRLSAATVVLPPLRDRQPDLPILARLLLEQACVAVGREPLELQPGAMRQLAAHTWPGNIRELKNLLDYLAATVSGGAIDADAVRERLTGHAAPAMPEEPARLHQPAAEAAPGTSFRNIHEELRDLERARMIEALQAADGVQTRAAALIGMPIRTFMGKVKQYGIPLDVPRRRARTD
jgi:transcriptional regulator with GAF, ATPase, and Fis domain